MICLPIRSWYAHSLVLKPSEKYMLLVKQLYGRNADGDHHNVDVVDNVVDVVDSYKENHALNAHD